MHELLSDEVSLLALDGVAEGFTAEWSCPPFRPGSDSAMGCCVNTLAKGWVALGFVHEGKMGSCLGLLAGADEQHIAASSHRERGRLFDGELVGHSFISRSSETRSPS